MVDEKVFEEVEHRVYSIESEEKFFDSLASIEDWVCEGDVFKLPSGEFYQRYDGIYRNFSESRPVKLDSAGKVVWARDW